MLKGPTQSLQPAQPEAPPFRIDRLDKLVFRGSSEETRRCFMFLSAC